MGLTGLPTGNLTHALTLPQCANLDPIKYIQGLAEAVVNAGISEEVGRDACDRNSGAAATQLRSRFCVQVFPSQLVDTEENKRKPHSGIPGYYFIDILFA